MTFVTLLFMMTQMQTLFANMDIYLIDQILKGTYCLNDKILDAGCGSGRNLKWFYNNTFNLHGIDQDSDRLIEARRLFPNIEHKLILGKLDKLPYDDNTFNHIICNAVLHFARDKNHFMAMGSELIRTAKPNGSIFVRMASNIGIDSMVNELSNGIYKLPEGSERFLLTRSLLKEFITEHRLDLLEPIKTVNVNDIRAMTTLVLKV